MKSQHGQADKALLLQGVLNASERASSLIKQLLAFSRKGSVEFSEVDLGQVLSSLFMDLAPKAPTPAQSPMNAMIVNFIREQYFTSVMSGDTKPEAAFSEMKQKIRAMSKGK